MNEKTKAFLNTGVGIVLLVINKVFAVDGVDLFGVLGNIIGTALFIWGIIQIVKAYRNKPKVM